MATKKDYIDFLLPIYEANYPRELSKQRRFLESDSLDRVGFDSGLAMVEMGLLFHEYFNDKKYLYEAKVFFLGVIDAFLKYKKNNAIPNIPTINRMFGVSKFCEIYMKISLVSFTA